MRQDDDFFLDDFEEELWDAETDSLGPEDLVSHDGFFEAEIVVEFENDDADEETFNDIPAPRVGGGQTYTPKPQREFSESRSDNSNWLVGPTFDHSNSEDDDRAFFKGKSGEIPDVHWKEDIENIDDDYLRDMQIEAAQKIFDKDRQVSDQYERGEIDDFEWEIQQAELIKESAQASTRAGLASVGITPDHLGDISEDNDFVQTGNVEMIEKKERLQETIDKIGPDAAQDLADRMLDEEKIGKEAHDMISRQARLHRLKK